MSKKTFFSIIIPTRNRPELLVSAISSVVSQTFLDREIIVVDNSDNDYSVLNRKICESFKEVVYIRTGGLNMADNWDYAFSQASGEYVCLLSDRLKWASATLLKRAYEAIEITDASVITWKWCNDPVSGCLPVKRSGLLGLFSSEDILNSFNNMDWITYTYMAPRGLNSIAHKNVLSKIRDRVGRVCLLTSPDYTSSFNILLATEFIAHVDENEVYSGGGEVSNGQKNTNNYASSKASLVALDVDEKYFDALPLKFMTVRNSLVADYMNVTRKWGVGRRFTNLNVAGYFDWVKADILQLTETPRQEVVELVVKYNKVALEYGIPPVKL